VYQLNNLIQLVEQGGILSHLRADIVVEHALEDEVAHSVVKSVLDIATADIGCDLVLSQFEVDHLVMRSLALVGFT
jgi:hypothetical protein